MSSANPLVQEGTPGPIERRGRKVVGILMICLPLLIATAVWKEGWDAAPLLLLCNGGFWAIWAKVGLRPMAQMMGAWAGLRTTTPDEEGLRRFFEGAALNHGLTGTVRICWTIGHTRQGYTLTALDSPMPISDRLLSHIYAQGQELCALATFGTPSFEQIRTWDLHLDGLTAHQRLERRTSARQIAHAWTG